MPKEYVESRYYGKETIDLQTGRPAEVEATRAQIGWTKNAEHVELGVVNPAVESTPGGAEAGWFMQLDRHGINRMIRLLRAARDQAFGKDE